MALNKQRPKKNYRIVNFFFICDPLMVYCTLKSAVKCMYHDNLLYFASEWTSCVFYSSTKRRGYIFISYERETKTISIKMQNNIEIYKEPEHMTQYFAICINLYPVVVQTPWAVRYQHRIIVCILLFKWNTYFNQAPHFCSFFHLI